MLSENQKLLYDAVDICKAYEKEIKQWAKDCNYDEYSKPYNCTTKKNQNILLNVSGNVVLDEAVKTKTLFDLKDLAQTKLKEWGEYGLNTYQDYYNVLVFLDALVLLAEDKASSQTIKDYIDLNKGIVSVKRLAELTQGDLDYARDCRNFLKKYLSEIAAMMKNNIHTLRNEREKEIRSKRMDRVNNKMERTHGLTHIHTSKHPTAIRAHKTTPKKTGVRYLENSVRRMF